MSDLHLLALDDPDDATPWLPAWEALAEDPMEPNVFHEPWFLRPAMADLAPPGFKLLIAVDDRSPRRGRVLGVFPVHLSRAMQGAPFFHISLWRHPLMLLGTPLIARDRVDEVLELLYQWVRARLPGTAVQWPLISLDGPLAAALDAYRARHDLPLAEFDAHERAWLTPTAPADQHLRAVMKRHRRKEIQRLARRLAEIGRREIVITRPGDPLGRSIERFITLEHGGWKGDRSTSMGSDPAVRRFAERALRSAHRRGRLEILDLRLDGRTIAMKLNLLTAPPLGGAFAFKITYDEEHASYSPGVQLEVENIDWAHAHPHVRWMDSCAAPDHPMIDRLWLERRAVGTWLLSAPSRRGRSGVRALNMARSVRRNLRAR